MLYAIRNICSIFCLLGITNQKGNEKEINFSSSKLPLISILILVLSGCAESGGSGSESKSESVLPRPPAVALTMENNNIYLNWSQGNANQYRVLYWKGNNAPEEQITTSTEYAFPPLSTGSYTVLVEAYDEMGNSTFSVPVALEVL